jgi:hypothetical protein
VLFDLRKGLDPIKQELLDEIDKQAGKIRCKYITTTEGQEMVYSEKRREAEALMLDLELSEAQTPHLTREAVSSGVSRYEKAVEIITMATQWAYISALIEDRRLSAKALINSATSVAEARGFANVDWTGL